MPFDYPVPAEEHEVLITEVEAWKLQNNLDQAIADAVIPRLLSKGIEVDRSDLSAAITELFNPQLCTYFAQVDPTISYLKPGENSEDSFHYTKSGHDDVNKLLDKLVRAAFPNETAKTRKTLVKGAHWVLFRYFKDQ